MSEEHCWMRIGDTAVKVHFSADGPVEVRITRGVHADIVGDTSAPVGSVRAGRAAERGAEVLDDAFASRASVI
jgi:hypothetical protein